MVYVDETRMSIPGWGLEEEDAECGRQCDMHAHREKHRQGRKPGESVLDDSWLCFDEDTKARGRVSSAAQEVIRIEPCQRPCFQVWRETHSRWPTALRVE